MAGCSGCRRRCLWLAEKLNLTCELVRGALYTGAIGGSVLGVWLAVK